MALSEKLNLYVEQRVPLQDCKKVSHIILAYIFLCAGLTFNLYTLFYWINFITSGKYQAGHLFPMEVVYMANIALIYYIISGTLMYHYRKRHRAFLNHMNVTIDTSFLNDYSTEELVKKLEQLNKRESLWKQKLDAGLIAGILSIEIATIDASNAYSFLIGFIIVPLIGFIIFGLFIDRYDEGLFSNTRYVGMTFLLRKTILKREKEEINSNQEQSVQIESLMDRLEKIEIQNQQLIKQIKQLNDKELDYEQRR